MYSLYAYVGFFLVYSFLGWCAEVIFNTVNTGKFVNRGFLNGPVCPIYGFGMVLVVLCLTPVYDNLGLLFVGSVLLTSLVEWLAGFILERFFATRWWDYSDAPFNLNGYICLKFSLLWGVGCLAVLKGVHPLIVSFLNWVPKTLGIVLEILFLLIMAADLVVTVLSIRKFNSNLKYLDELSRGMRIISDEIGEGLANPALRLAEKGEQLKKSSEQLTVDAKQKTEVLLGIIQTRKEHITQVTGQAKKEVLDRLEANKQKLASLLEEYERVFEKKKPERLFKAFPKQYSTKYNEELQAIKERILQRQNKTKKKGEEKER